MEKKTIRVKGNEFGRGMGHNRTTLLSVTDRLYCPCGCLVYEGKKPNFSRISCPKCKGVFDVPRT